MTLPDLRKPSEREGKAKITPRERRALLERFCEKQGMLCATCGKRMTRKPFHPNTATLGHRTPQPMGCAKDDRPENLVGAQCWECNYRQGSKRLRKGSTEDHPITPKLEWDDPPFG